MSKTQINGRVNFETGERIYEIRLSRRDLAMLKLDKFDQALIDSPLSEETPMADMLQSLQTIMFRIEQQAAPSPQLEIDES